MGRTSSLLLAALLGAGCGAPRASLFLSLTKQTWEEGEFLWYKLEIRNEGLKALEFLDSFWFDQQSLGQNMRHRQRTYFIVRDERGSEVSNLLANRGFHGEFVFWANDCGSGVLCSANEDQTVKIPARRTLTATPSIERPVQTSGVWSDARRCDRLLSPGDCAASRKLVESYWKFGDPRRTAAPAAAAASPLPGHRILDSLAMPGPGKYSIQAVVDLRSSVPPASVEEELASPEVCSGIRREACELAEARVRRDWAEKSPEALAEARRKRDSVLKYNASRLIVFSRAIEFEVVPAKRAGPSLRVETLADLEKMVSSGPKLREPPPGEGVVVGSP